MSSADSTIRSLFSSQTKRQVSSPSLKALLIRAIAQSSGGNGECECGAHGSRFGYQSYGFKHTDQDVQHQDDSEEEKDDHHHLEFPVHAVLSIHLFPNLIIAPSLEK